MRSGQVLLALIATVLGQSFLVGFGAAEFFPTDNFTLGVFNTQTSAFTVLGYAEASPIAGFVCTPALDTCYYLVQPIVSYVQYELGVFSVSTGKTTTYSIPGLDHVVLVGGLVLNGTTLYVHASTPASSSTTVYAIYSVNVNTQATALVADLSAFHTSGAAVSIVIGNTLVALFPGYDTIKHYGSTTFTPSQYINVTITGSGVVVSDLMELTEPGVGNMGVIWANGQLVTVQSQSYKPSATTTTGTTVSGAPQGSRGTTTTGAHGEAAPASSSSSGSSGSYMYDHMFIDSSVLLLGTGQTLENNVNTMAPGTRSNPVPGVSNMGADPSGNVWFSITTVAGANRGTKLVALNSAGTLITETKPILGFENRYVCGIYYYSS